MKNINRDYLVKVDTKSATITAPSNMKFFITDENTSNIFFQLDFKDTNDVKITDLINDKAPKEDYNIYSLTLRVVKPNYETKEIKAVRLKEDDPCFFIVDLPKEYTDMSGTYECELFIDAEIEKNDVPYIERSTTNSFTYTVVESIFYNLDDTIYDEYDRSISIRDYINGLITGKISLSPYVTYKDLNTKADKEHTHKEYITREALNSAIAEVDKVKIDLDDFTASNSISINRNKYTVIGDYSTALGDNTVASEHASHAEGYETMAKGKGAHAEGGNTKASGYFSHAEGYHTTAIGEYQHVQGKYNIADTTNYAHIVGNGSEDEPSNAHTLDWEGNAWFAGNITVGEDNKELATKEYVDDEVLSTIEDRINEAISKGDIEIECDYVYDDTEIKNSITELGNSVERSLASKADKKIGAPIYEGVNSLDIGSLELYDENRRYIRVVNPNELLSIKLPNSIDADFAEIHAIIAPIDNGAEISISINNNTEHANLKYQDKNLMPFFLEPDTVYEFIFTYIDCGNDSCRWLVGAIVYE